METTFLTEEQIIGDDALEAMVSYDAKVALTDLSVILGGRVTYLDSVTSEGDKCGDSLTASSDFQGFACSINCFGDTIGINPSSRFASARPALSPSTTSTIRPDKTKIVNLKNGKKVKIGTFGEYPQTVASDKISKDLESAYKSGNLKTTSKKYTFDSVNAKDNKAKFQPKDHQEFVFGSKRYIRVEGNPSDMDSTLSNGRKIEKGKPYWVEVQPIEWIIDKSGTWFSKKCLFAGIPFDNKDKCDGNFEKTTMKAYLDKYFSNEMQFEYAATNVQKVEKQKPSKRLNDYGITVEDAPMPVKDQIDFYIKSGMSFMLHGPSGVGKTRRVEDIDPDLTAVPLYNGVLPEDIVGKVIYPSGTAHAGDDENQAGGKWVAPDWYNELCKKCEKEPNKQHVLFIDEVTNARPTTQSLIFHVVLKKSISPSKGKLPKNSVVVLAGNSKEESGAAYNMPEPLFRRMVGHVHLEPNVQDWLEWASEKNRENPDRLNVHPIVSSFVATYGNQVFYSSYDEETPPKWAIDPRGWEQVSDVIYDNKGVIRRELLEAKMGKELTTSFLAYVKNPPLSMKEVIEGKYEPYDIPEGNDEKLALTLSLRHADDKQIKTVRKFIGDNLGKENLAVFDSVWVGKSEDRAMQIHAMQFKKGTTR